MPLVKSINLWCHDFDETKLEQMYRDLIYRLWNGRKVKEYNIQIELSDLNNIMGIVSIGDTEENVVALINALKDISSKTEIKEYRKHNNHTKS